jgi:hypothetical protein
MAAKGAFSDTPMVRKPAGRSITRSPWLIQTWSREPRGQTPSKSGLSSSTSTKARPNSRWVAVSTRPPSCAAMVIWP